MYSKVLVPLDGSSFSEISLAHVKAIAKGCSIPEVILFRVIEPVPSGYASMGEDWQRDADKRAKEWTQNYLAEVAERMKRDGVNVKTVMTEGNAAEQILNYANKNKVDLIIMSTHGSSGIVRWMLGSVTDRVVRHAQIPVLVVSAQSMKSGR